MQLILDSDVEKVLDFMVREIDREKLLFVSRAVAQVAELAWADAVPNRRPRNALQMSPEVLIPASASRARLAAT